MLKNVGTIDKRFRIALGVVCISQVFFGLQTPIGWIGVIMIATGLINFCPVYKMFGFKTIREKTNTPESERKVA